MIDAAQYYNAVVLNTCRGSQDRQGLETHLSELFDFGALAFYRFHERLRRLLFEP